MAKEFKEYDKLYKELRGILLKGESTPDALTHWPYISELKKSSHQTTREAVYLTNGAEQWQQFRVSLKGFSTEIKLGRLKNRWDQNIYNPIEIIRINNYIDSMKRSGLINLHGQVIK